MSRAKPDVKKEKIYMYKSGKRREKCTHKLMRGKNMKKIGKIASGIVIVAALAGIFGIQREEYDMQKSIAKKIIRFHVIANSDSEADQALKLKVKERVVESMQPVLAQTDNVDEARQLMKDHLNEIEQTAAETLREENSNYPVHAELTNSHFPVKTYGEFTFPDGEYEALRVVIGDGEGKNWWCVMYPRLCFVDSLYTVVPEKSKKELKTQLTDEEYEELLTGEKPVKIKWKFAEWLGL